MTLDPPISRPRAAAVNACADWARYEGVDPDVPFVVEVRTAGPTSLTLRHEGPLPPPTDETAMPRIPPYWQRILDVLAGAGKPLAALEIERRVRRGFEGDRPTPEVAIRLQDMLAIGLVVRTRTGYRLPDAPPAGPESDAADE